VVSNTLNFVRPQRTSAAERSLDEVKVQIEALVQQRSTLPNEQLTAELQAMMDVLIQEGRKFGWDAERALLLARPLGAGDDSIKP
jgi:hypothetical protein